MLKINKVFMYIFIMIIFSISVLGYAKYEDDFNFKSVSNTYINFNSYCNYDETKGQIKTNTDGQYCIFYMNRTLNNNYWEKNFYNDSEKIKVTFNSNVSSGQTQLSHAFYYRVAGSNNITKFAIYGYIQPATKRFFAQCNLNVTNYALVTSLSENYDIEFVYNMFEQKLQLTDNNELSEVLLSPNCRIDKANGDWIQELRFETSRSNHYLNYFKLESYDAYDLLVNGVLPNGSFICPTEKCLFYDDYVQNSKNDLSPLIYIGDLNSMNFFNNTYMNLNNSNSGVKYIKIGLMKEDFKYNLKDKLDITFNLNNGSTPNNWGNELGSGNTYGLGIECENNKFISVVNFDFLRYTDSFGNHTLIKVWDIDENANTRFLQDYIVLNNNKITFSYDINKKWVSENNISSIGYNYYDISFKETFGFQYQALSIITDYPYNYNAKITNQKFFNNQSCETIKYLWLSRKDKDLDDNFLTIDKISLNTITTYADVTNGGSLIFNENQDDIVGDFGSMIFGKIENFGFKSETSKYILVVLMLVGVTILVLYGIKGFSDSGSIIKIVLPILYTLIIVMSWRLKLISDGAFAIIVLLLVVVGTIFILRLLGGGNN